jgi:WD40 repeat protein
LNVEDFGGLGVLARIDMTVYPVIYSPDRKRLLAGAEGGGLILDAESGRELLRFEVSFAGFPVAVAYRPDGRRITSGSDDGAVIIWDAESGRELRTIAGEDTVCAAFRPDGNQLVSAGEDGVIRPWGQDTDK